MVRYGSPGLLYGLSVIRNRWGFIDERLAPERSTASVAVRPRSNDAHPIAANPHPRRPLPRSAGSPATLKNSILTIFLQPLYPSFTRIRVICFCYANHSRHRTLGRKFYAVQKRRVDHFRRLEFVGLSLSCPVDHLACASKGFAKRSIA